MRAKIFFLLLFLVSCLVQGGENKAITWNAGSRLGDSLLDYTRAKWISYKYSIPLLYKQFKYSDQLVLSDVEEAYTAQKAAQFKKIPLANLTQIEEKTKGNTLFSVAHYDDSWDGRPRNNPHVIKCHVPVDWNDQTFLKMMRELIAPKYPLNLVSVPKKIVSVALHYRTGGDYDTVRAKQNFVFRFPSLNYYINQLEQLYELVDRQPMHVYIFTDDSKPHILKQKLKKNFPHPNVVFEFRKQGNKHDNNVLEDLFSMMKFDCLIRPHSHFSIVASRLGNFKIEIFPKGGNRKNGVFEIDQVHVIEKAQWDRNKKKWTFFQKNV